MKDISGKLPLALSALTPQSRRSKRPRKSKGPSPASAHVPDTRVTPFRGITLVVPTVPASLGRRASASSLQVGPPLSPSAPVLATDRFRLHASGRFMGRAERVRAVKRALLKARRRLEKSMAHIPDPRAGDLARWASLRGEIRHLETVLGELLAGGDPPGSPRTGSKTRELPDALK